MAGWDLHTGPNRTEVLAKVHMWVAAHLKGLVLVILFQRALDG